jgi:hypothetical protein
MALMDAEKLRHSGSSHSNGLTSLMNQLATHRRSSARQTLRLRIAHPACGSLVAAWPIYIADLFPRGIR